MEIARQVAAVLAVLTSLLMTAKSQYYYNSPGGQNQENEKIVEHIVAISDSSLLPAVPVYGNPVNSYGYPAYTYRSAPMGEGCQSSRQARGVFIAPYPGRHQISQYSGPEVPWYPSAPMGYRPAMRSAQNQWMNQPDQQSYYEQSYYQQFDEPTARSSRTFGAFRDLLPGIFSNDNEHVQNDIAYQVPQNYNNIPPATSSSSAPIQTYY